MTDIVERLRATQDDWPACLVVLEQEAADEIERLREALREILELKNDMGLIANDIARDALGEKES